MRSRNCPVVGSTTPDRNPCTPTGNCATPSGSRCDVVLLASADAPIDSPEVAAAGRELADGLAHAQGVERVESYWTSGQLGATLRSKDGRKALIRAQLAGDDNELAKRVRVLAAQFGDKHRSVARRGDRLRGVARPNRGHRKTGPGQVGGHCDTAHVHRTIPDLPRRGRRPATRRDRRLVYRRNDIRDAGARRRHRRVDLRDQPGVGTRAGPRHRLQPADRRALPRGTPGARQTRGHSRRDDHCRTYGRFLRRDGRFGAVRTRGVPDVLPAIVRLRGDLRRRDRCRRRRRRPARHTRRRRTPHRRALLRPAAQAGATGHRALAHDRDGGDAPARTDRDCVGRRARGAGGAVRGR